jgi:CRP/FNR family transcriptional regulator
VALPRHLSPTSNTAPGGEKASIQPDARPGERLDSHPKPSESLVLFRQIPYFAVVGDDALGAVARKAIRRTYEPGQMIFLEGEPCTGLHIVQSGLVKVFKVSLEGREQVLHVLCPGTTFNDVAVFDGGPNPVSAIALEPTTIWIVNRTSMLALLHTCPALAMTVVGRLSAMARHLVHLVETLSFCDVTSRLARLLLDRAQPGNALFELEGRRRMTQAEMAAHLGTVREMVGRSLRELEQEGLVEIDRHRILIHDADRLRARAQM